MAAMIPIQLIKQTIQRSLEAVISLQEPEPEPRTRRAGWDNLRWCSQLQLMQVFATSACILRRNAVHSDGLVLVAARSSLAFRD